MSELKQKPKKLYGMAKVRAGDMYGFCFESCIQEEVDGLGLKYSRKTCVRIAALVMIGFSVKFRRSWFISLVVDCKHLV